MQSALLPVFYLPPISWFAEFLDENTDPVLEKWENLAKQTYRNRCEIYGANGKLVLSIPLKHNGSRLYKDTEISFEENWQKIHWKSIKIAYQSSPYFEFYENKLEKIYQFEGKNLFEFNLNVLQILLEILKSEKPIIFSESYVSEPFGTDFRSMFKSKNKESKNHPEYYQTFTNAGFLEDLSIIDLLCNLGPESSVYLKNLKK